MKDWYLQTCLLFNATLITIVCFIFKIIMIILLIIQEGCWGGGGDREEGEGEHEKVLHTQ